MENPLLDLYKLSNDQFIPFDKIKSEHFEPAFEIAFAAAQENLNKIINNDEDPTFENTIEAIEYCGEQLDAIVKLFENLKETHKNNEIDRIAEIVMPKVTDWNNDLMLNEKLFERVKSVYTTRPSLNNEQQRLLEINYNNFVREGALLSLANKQILKTYNKQLEVLSRTFAKNLLEATNGYELVIEDELDLAGLPNRVRQIAKEEANARGKNNCWVFTLHHPSYSPFLQYADKENLRKNLLFALRSRAMQGKTNNQPIVLEIITLRDKKAKLLGYKTHADFVLQNRMAKSPDVVYTYMRLLTLKQKKILKN
jgi:peptidyl-dipeptidase Dcp